MARAMILSLYNAIVSTIFGICAAVLLIVAVALWALYALFTWRPTPRDPQWEDGNPRCPQHWRGRV